MNIGVHFEIPVTHFEQAVQFYEAVFELQLERQMIDGNEMALFPLTEGAEGCSGALAKGESYIPAIDGTRIYLTVADIDKTLHKALQAGAVELYPVTEVSQGIRVAEFKDPEGNRIALYCCNDWLVAKE